jgi:type VI secretion system Hcp family effector
MQITVKVEKTAGTVSIPGESTVADHTGEIDAIAIRDLIQAPTGSASAKVSEIFLTRERDKASPKLAQACSMGENVGTVTIYLLKNVNGNPKPFMTYTLTETFVSRIEHETAEANGGAYLPHQGFSSTGGNVFGVLWRAAGLNQNADRAYSRDRAQPNPVYAMPMGAATDKEIERVWLSPATIKWTYTPYASDGLAGGNVEKGWNLQTSAELAA